MPSVSPFPHRRPEIDWATCTEPQLWEAAVRTLGGSFEIQREVPGTFLGDGSPVRIDLLLRPRPATVARGFHDAWFGIEIKSAAVKERKKQGLALAWQAITYSLSEFSGRRPAFVLTFLGQGYFWDEQERLVASYLQSLLIRSNVGELRVNGRDQSDWSMRFAGMAYFSNRRGLSPTAWSALKRRVGNSK